MKQAFTLMEVLVLVCVLTLIALVVAPMLTEKQNDVGSKPEVKVGWIIDLPNRGWYRVRSIEENGVIAALTTSSARSDDNTTLIPISWKEIRASGVKVMRLDDPESPETPP